MPAPEPPPGTGPFGRMDQLYYHVGRGLLAWQGVEEEHFKLFFKLIGAPLFQNAAVVYFGMGDFATRHRVVSNLITVTLIGDEFKKERKLWQNNASGLQKDIKDANDERNKLAHYEPHIGSTVQQGPGSGRVVRIALAGPTLRPSAYNLVTHLLGNTPDKDAHNLTISAIAKLSQSFKSLSERICEFREQCPLPPDAGFVQRNGPPPKHLLDRKRKPST